MVRFGRCHGAIIGITIDGRLVSFVENHLARLRHNDPPAPAAAAPHRSPCACGTRTSPGVASCTCATLVPCSCVPLHWTLWHPATRERLCDYVKLPSLLSKLPSKEGADTYMRRIRHAHTLATPAARGANMRARGRETKDSHSQRPFPYDRLRTVRAPTKGYARSALPTTGCAKLTHVRKVPHGRRTCERSRSSHALTTGKARSTAPAPEELERPAQRPTSEPAPTPDRFRRAPGPALPPEASAWPAAFPAPQERAPTRPADRNNRR